MGSAKRPPDRGFVFPVLFYDFLLGRGWGEGGIGNRDDGRAFLKSSETAQKKKAKFFVQASGHTLYPHWKQILKVAGVVFTTGPYSFAYVTHLLKAFT